MTADDPSVDADDAAHEPITVPEASSTAAASSDPASPATTSTTQVIPGAPLLGERAGFQVAFLGPRRTLLLDLDTGVLRVVQHVEHVAVLGVTDLGLLVRSFVDSESSMNLAVWPAPYDGSEAIVLNDTWTDPMQAWVSSSGQQVWEVSGGPDSTAHVVRHDLVEETASTFALEQLGLRTFPFGVVGDALALGAPGGAYLLSGDGRIDRISTGELVATSPDWLLVDMCDPQLSCAVQVIDPRGRPFSTQPELDRADLFGGLGPRTFPAIAPDGRLATVRSDSIDSATLVVDGVDVSPLSGRAVSGWSPDGRWLLALDSGELVVIDTTRRGDPARIALRAGLARERIVTFPTPV